AEFLGEMFIVFAEAIRVRGIVIGDHDGFLGHPNVAFQSTKEALGEMGCFPVGIGLTEPVADLLGYGLGDQGQRHVAITDRANAPNSASIIGAGLISTTE